MSAHTPGPWEAKGIHVRMSDGFSFEQQTPIGEGACCQTKQRNQERREANARLIASAPDLLKKLEACERHLENLYGNTTDGDEPNREEEDGWILLCEVRAEIGKAKGESPWTSTH